MTRMCRSDDLGPQEPREVSTFDGLSGAKCVRFLTISDRIDELRLLWYGSVNPVEITGKKGEDG